MTTINGTIPNAPEWGSVITPEGIASMVGQTARLTINGDWREVFGEATITTAAPDGDRIVFTADATVYGSTPPAVTDLLASPAAPYSIGYQDHRTTVRVHELRRLSDPPAAAPVTTETERVDYGAFMAALRALLDTLDERADDTAAKSLRNAMRLAPDDAGDRRVDLLLADLEQEAARQNALAAAAPEKSWDRGSHMYAAAALRVVARRHATAPAPPIPVLSDETTAAIVKLSEASRQLCVSLAHQTLTEVVASYETLSEAVALADAVIAQEAPRG